MKKNPPTTSSPPPTGNRHPFLLAGAAFALGVALTSVWFQRHPAAPATSDLPVATPNAPTDPGTAPVPNQPLAARPLVAPAPPLDPAAVTTVKAALPHYASQSLADGENDLRMAALAELRTAAAATDAQIKAAQEKYLAAQNDQSAAAQQAALQELEHAQAAATEKLQEVSARLSAQILALKSLKNGQ